MNDLWKHLEEQSRSWDELNRQGLAGAIWSDYVTARFRRTGDPGALKYLYPYLVNVRTRARAVRTACTVFEGGGPRAAHHLTYFTQNPDEYLKDRSVVVVGAALAGSSPPAILDTLSPFLESRNSFVRKQAVIALGSAARGHADETILTAIQETAGKTPDLLPGAVAAAIASVYSGSPDEKVYDLVDPSRNLEHCALLVQNADEDWFNRFCDDALDRAFTLEPLPEDGGAKWRTINRHISAVRSSAIAGRGRSIPAFERMLRVRNGGKNVKNMLNHGPRCFLDVSEQDCVPYLKELARGGDVPSQRVAAVCLGRRMLRTDDEDTIGLLTDLCGANNRSVRASALRGLATAARSSCDERLRALCLEQAADPETAREAILTLGAVFLASGRRDVFDDIQGLVVGLRSQPEHGNRHNKPLSTCYAATGLVYLGTGATDPIEFLLDGIARPKASRSRLRWYGNPWGIGSAARALVLIDFPESVIGDFIER